jgi:hypothetical protein
MSKSTMKLFSTAAAIAAAGFLTIQSADASAIGSTIASKIDVSNYRHYLDDLLYTHAGANKGIGGGQHDLCRTNIFNTLQSFGLSVQLSPFTYQSVTYFNVVATKVGWQFPNAQYIIGAHYDSVNNPGADDDSSGVAAVMEIARILAAYDNRYTIKFILWDREEQGKIGSTAYVSQHTGEDIRGMVQLDMIAHDVGNNREDLYSNAASASLKNAVIAAIGSYGNGLQVGDVGPATFSDHAPFNNAGYQAICFVEHNYTTFGCYHQLCDNVDVANYIQYPFAANLTRSIAGWLTDVAGISRRGDITNDGVVNIDDLLAVINAWGACPPPPPAPPANCPADMPRTAGGTGDGTVNIDDLLVIINNWG